MSRWLVLRQYCRFALKFRFGSQPTQAEMDVDPALLDWGDLVHLAAIDLSFIFCSYLSRFILIFVVMNFGIQFGIPTAAHHGHTNTTAHIPILSYGWEQPSSGFSRRRSQVT
jgi:hypothetical protein